MKLINKKIILLFFVVAVALLMGATECTCTFAFNDYTANAVNIKAADVADGFYKDATNNITLVGTTVSLYPYNASTGTYSSTAYDTATVTSIGSFTFLSPEPNRYKLTATSADWIFVPQYIEITNSGSSAKDLYAYPKTGAGEYTIIASWENTDMDVDLTLTYGEENAASTSAWTTGDTQAAANERLRIYYGGRGSTDGTGISLDMDVTADDPLTVSRVETISLHDASWLKDGDTIKVYLDTALAADVLTGLEGTDPSAYAQVDLMYYNSVAGTSEHYGTWYMPWNTYENTIQVIQISYNAGTQQYTISSANNAATLYSDGVAYPGNIKSIIGEN